MEDNTVSHFVVLFTAQKARKNKIWQDGFLKYYSFNKKLVLIDEKGYNIDRKFNKGGRPAVGDELEFDGHIVTIEEYQSTEIANVNQPSRVNVNQPSRVNVSLPDRQLNKEPPKENVQKQSKNAPFKPPSFVPKKRMIKSDSEEEDPMDIDDKPTLPSSSIPTSSTAVTPPVQPTPAQPTPIGSSSCVPLKRARMGLSKKTTSVLHQHIAQQTTPPPQQTSFQPASSMTAQATTNTPKHASTETPKVSPEQTISGHKDPTETKYTSMILQFPNSRKALGLVKSKNYPKRSKVVPAKFKNPALYQNTFRAIINEHLEILLLNYGMYFHSVYEKLGKNKHGQDLERTMRSKGIAIYVQNELKQENPRYGQSTFRLMLRSNREHHSKYNRDDIWIISNVPSFESSQTFLARSTFFGPFSDGSLELHCLSARDARVASQVMKKETSVYALRTISASTEFMMLDTLDQQLHELPVLPYLLSNPRLSKKAKPLPTLEHIRLTQHDHVDIEARIRETIQYHKLNADQEAVLRQVAKSVIYCPGWNEQLEQPIVLVHGVYGSGKSFLAAVIIIFLQDLIDTVNGKREPEDAISFKILVSSMTNVAVDRILQTLLKLGYDHFIRIGSMKKIAKNLLPFTAKARASSNEELKELEQMLEDSQNTEEDMDHIATAIQRFRKSESTNQIHAVQVVGTTFMSSTFEVFDGIQFPLILVDESSQLMEPLTLVPLARFMCHRLVMIGDPLQLPPTLATNAEESKVGQGLDKTLFDRMMEMGYDSIMLRTQYRCHPRISNISNKLFYDQRLLNGVDAQDRKPLIEGLPTLLFVNVGGFEQKSKHTNSYWNEAEVAVSAHIIQSLLSLQIPAVDLGVISLYKEQTDKLVEYLKSTDASSTNRKVQISTVDAFQGGEKDVIILSTVRTSESQFMDNQLRINVALTRAKRHLIILGNQNVFSMNPLWSNILWDCQEHCMNAKSVAVLLSNLKID